MGGLITLGAWSAAVGGVLGGALGSAVGRAAGAASAGAASASRAVLERLPGKWPLRRLTHRPPNYETPIGYLRTAITPNEAFFVRYHHSVIPEIEPAEFRLELTGEGVERPQVLSLAQLQTVFTPVTVIAVCQCSGNRRGLFDPPVPGLQWEHGAMGCAEWRGVRLAEVLASAGLKDSVLEIAFDAADAPPLEPRLGDERRTLAAAQRRAAAARRAGLDSDLLDQAPHPHRGAHRTGAWLLDGERLPHAARGVPAGGALPVTGGG
jgi:DMSO/TMAO reductase YedYZ molybdopterin-dependent catalytic subunit